MGAGGPDVFGYKWSDSDQPGGPAFSWFDISSIGTPITFATTDDSNSGPFNIGFSFPFYEGEFTTAHVATNGHVNFSARSTALANTALPNPAAPHAAIYPMWDDLYFDATSALYTATTQVDGVDAFVLEWRDVTFFADRNERTNFSVTLLANGEIEIGYGDNSGGALSAGSSGPFCGAPLRARWGMLEGRTLSPADRSIAPDFMVSAMRLRSTSTSLTRTFTTSPAFTTSRGSLTKRSDSSEMCTSPS